MTLKVSQVLSLISLLFLPLLIVLYLSEGGKKMKIKKLAIMSLGFNTAFILWTFLIGRVDVESVGVNGTYVGFATVNTWFHSLTGVNMALYNITDWLGLVPIFICFIFGILGLIQLSKRKSLFKVDLDIVLLGIYYIIVIFCYLIFEMIPINFRPILINGFLEASYPSSTTLLVMSVMPTLIFECNIRLKNITAKRLVCVLTLIFTLFMVIGRMISGVHWLTDIIGSVFLSLGLFFSYKCFITLIKGKKYGI